MKKKIVKLTDGELITIETIRRCKRALECQEALEASNRQPSPLHRIVVNDLRRDCRETTLVLEIQAFEYWQHQKPSLEESYIRLKVNTALANLR